MADNTITVVGNITRDPELRFTTGGKAIVGFGLAHNRRWNQNGEWKENVSFFNVSAWDQLAENIAASFTKGDRIIVTGRLEQRTYEKNGEKQSTVEIVADEVGGSVRWATLQIQRIEREGKGGSRSAQRAADPVYGDDEPF